MGNSKKALLQNQIYLKKPISNKIINRIPSKESFKWQLKKEFWHMMIIIIFWSAIILNTTFIFLICVDALIVLVVNVDVIIQDTNFKICLIIKKRKKLKIIIMCKSVENFKIIYYCQKLAMVLEQLIKVILKAFRQKLQKNKNLENEFEFHFQANQAINKILLIGVIMKSLKITNDLKYSIQEVILKAIINQTTNLLIPNQKKVKFLKLVLLKLNKYKISNTNGILNFS